VSSSVRILWVCFVASLAGGCASVQVRSVGTNSGQAAFDLVGPDIASLASEAERLCPQGHSVKRQWQRGNRPVDEGNAVADWLLRTALLSYDLQPEQAQMSITCKA
jgi:hypothetical protein